MSDQERPAPTGYTGLVTRALALLVDSLLVDAIAVAVGGAATLIASLLGRSGGLSVGQALAGGLAWALWSVVYFVTFWNLTGQTPGSRLLGIRVISTRGDDITLRQAAWRFVWMVLSLLPLGAGFLPVLVDGERRGLHDRMAHTVVRWDAGELPEAAAHVPAALPPESESVPMPVAGQHVPIG
jgi:uncharacterized RDD family membrane protein YckC